MKIEEIILDSGFDAVYDYRNSGRDFSHTSFKILYDSWELTQDSDYKQLKTCVTDFLRLLGNLEFEEDNEDLNYIIENVSDADLKKFIDKNCKLIQAENNISLGPHIPMDMKMDRHLFYKVNIAPKFKLEVEKYNPKELNVWTEDEAGRHYFEDDKLNQVMTELDIEPDFLSIFVVRQTEYGVGDKVFRQIFDKMGEEVYSLNTNYYLKK